MNLYNDTTNQITEEKTKPGFFSHSSLCKHDIRLMHELHTSLGSVKQLNRSLLYELDKQQVGEEKYELLLSMFQKIEESSILVDNFSKKISLNNSTLKAQPEFIDMNGVLSNHIENYKPITGLKGISVRHKTESLLMGLTDMELFRSLIRNIFFLVFKNAQSNSEVGIHSCVNEADRILIKFTYQGIPIESDENSSFALCQKLSELISGTLAVTGSEDSYTLSLSLKQ